MAASIDAAVFDLKAVNPNVVTVVGERTPNEIIKDIVRKSASLLGHYYG